MDIPVAATVRTGRKKGESPLSHGPRDIAVRIAVAAARRLDAQIAGFERHRADIQGPCIRTDARYAVDQIDSRDAIYVDRQRMRLMTRSGIRKVNTVEHDHRLVEGTSPDHNVRLRSPAAPFPKIDRRAQTQHRLEGLDRRRSTRLSIENGGERHRTARGGGFHPVTSTVSISSSLAIVSESTVCACTGVVVDRRMVDIETERTPMVTWRRRLAKAA